MLLRDLDLNLLVKLNALLTERHVSHAADRVGISQPAMSAALAKLRDLFHDPLLVRTPNGLVLTERAAVLAESVSRLLADVNELVEWPVVFDPRSARFTYRITGTDYVEAIVLPSLRRELDRAAPGIKLHQFPPDPKRFPDQLARGELDLGIGYIPAPRESLHARRLFTDRFVCIVRRDHPRVRGALSITDFSELPHVQVLPRDFEMYATPIDAALAALGLVREVALWQPSFLAIPRTVTETDLIATVPERLARLHAQSYPLQVMEVPVALPSFDVDLLWHERTHDDSAHRWMREFVLGLGLAG